MYYKYMNGYISHLSAAFLWNIPYIEEVLDEYAGSETRPEEVTFSNLSSMYTKKGRVTHLCKLALPAGAIVSRNGQRIASPELMFLELAHKMDIHRLILLGLQLCSHPPGEPSKAIITKQKLKNFLAKTPGHRGHSKAVRAVKYIENSSASIMESIVFMILTLPHILGGYKIDGAVFNHEFVLNEESRKTYGRNRCFTDLYYKAERVAVEYDSFTYHSRPIEQGIDAIRSVMLKRQGVEVMHLSTIQLYNKVACRDFALQLAARIGKRVHIRTNKFNEMHEHLRKLLPKVKPSDEGNGGISRKKEQPQIKIHMNQ